MAAASRRVHAQGGPGLVHVRLGGRGVGGGASATAKFRLGQIDLHLPVLDVRFRLAQVRLGLLHCRLVFAIVDGVKELAGDGKEAAAALTAHFLPSLK